MLKYSYKRVIDIVIDGKLYDKKYYGELYLLINKKEEHSIGYMNSYKIFDMNQHTKYNTIKILNKDILNEEFIAEHL